MLPLSVVAFGQLDSNFITVTASRNTTSTQPDQAVFGVQVNSGIDTSLDDVIAALQGSGITIANFVGLNTNFLAITQNPVSVPVPAQLLQALAWSFRFAAPLTKMKDTVTTLSALQQSIAKKNPGLTLSFSVQGTQSSGQSQQACSLSDLLSDARTQAQKLASGAGVTVGNILAMSSPTGLTVGGFAGVSPLGALTAPVPSLSACTLTVKFALLRF